ncbi:MAG: phosphohistidine phosphatase SixA [Verrucomicrobiota bacterium]|nr:phosphohistidine phosphatase SixA [Verrucomicrobiota bacterium]
MMLYLMRHAEAVNSSPDALRPLTEHGRKTVRTVAQFLKGKRLFRPECIYHSTLLRAIQTSQLFAEELGMQPLLTAHDELTPDSSLAGALQLIGNSSSSLAIVGHNPHLSYLANYLLGGEISHYSIDLRKTDLLCLERQDYVVGVDQTQTVWTIRWYLTEKLFT